VQQYRATHTVQNKNIVKQDSSEIAECGRCKVLNGEKYQAGSEESYGSLQATQEGFTHAGDGKTKRFLLIEYKKRGQKILTQRNTKINTRPLKEYRTRERIK
jgi:hypothetical protein